MAKSGPAHRRPAHRRKGKLLAAVRTRQALLLGVVAACVAILAAGIGYAVTQSGGSAVAAPAVLTSDQSPGLPSVEVYPADRSSGVAVDTPISVVSPNSRVASVQVTGGPGAPITGSLAANGHSWYAPPGTLGTGATYTVDVHLAGSGGGNRTDQQTDYKTSFTTVTPRATLAIDTTYPVDNATVGVGMPIVIRFNAPVSDKAAVQARLDVQMSAPVPGGWHWFSDTEVHYRPESYWPKGEHVVLSANLSGVDAGNGVWGDSTKTLQFTVGDSHISMVDVVNHTMTVTSNGVVVKTMPISAGRPKYPTMNGIHFVWWKQPDVLMDSATVGIPRDSPDGYYEHVYQDVAISTGGEYVHSAPWSVGEQGNSNVSHGCVNLAPDNATWFYQFSQQGDIVQVTGSPRPPTADEGVADWNLSWSDWQAGSAI